MATEHRTAAVALNADVVGYSALVADDVDATTAALAEYHRIVNDEVGAAGGTIANFVGDSFMAVFTDVMAALRAAIAIATEAERRNADLPAARHVRFRMGMDQGSVVADDGQYHGDALNVAARIQAIAPPGGLAVSGSVYRALDEPALRFRAMGRHRLKNIPEQIDVFEFTDLPRDRPAGGHRSLALEAPTVAVLPIHTERVDDQVREAAGIVREDLLHRLAQVPELQVVDARDEPQGELRGAGARYILESGVHQIGGQVRVYAALFDVTTMNVVKTHKRTAQAEQLFEVSDDLAAEVARSVEVDLVVGEPAGLYADLGDARAIEQVYLGWFHLRTVTREGWARAMNLFGQVTASHPEQPYGYVLTAFALWFGVSNEWVPDRSIALADAREQARAGMQIGDPTGMASAVEAAILMTEGRAEEALRILDDLEIIRPTCDVTFGLEGSVRRYLGQWQRAVELLDVAMRLTGINKPWYPTVKASSLYVGGRHEEAAYLAESVLEYQPHNLEALLVLAAAQAALGMERRARGTAELIRQRFPSTDVTKWLDDNPYQPVEIIDRWKLDLVSAGAILDGGTPAQAGTVSPAR